MIYELCLRMKYLESMETDRIHNVNLPIYARIDGRNFSKFTKDMDKPYYKPLSNAMIDVTKYLVKETNALIGYTQSDEINLCWLVNNENSNIIFGGKIHKMTSILASMATAKFAMMFSVPHSLDTKCPHFDCRVISLPNKNVCADMFLWRSLDGHRNAINSVAQQFLSHKELQGKNQNDIIKILNDKNINFDDYPDFFKNGTFVRRKNILKDLDEKTLSKIPEKNRPLGPVLRTIIEEIKMPPFKDVENRIGVIFNNEEPIKNDGE